MVASKTTGTIAGVTGVTSARRLTARYVWPWTILAPLCAVIIVAALTLLDPFGFESATKRQSARIFYKIYAPTYPTTNRDEITLVLLDEATLDEYKEPWPPSHIVHHDVIAKILSMKPALLFVDLLFRYHREDDHFTRTKDELDRTTIPVFFAAASQLPPARPEVMDLVERHKIKLVSVEVEGQPDSPRYPLHDDPRTGYVPAALAMFRTICAIRPKFNCAHDDIPGKHPKQMEIAWGFVPADYNCYRSQFTPGLENLCEDLSSSWLGRTERLLWEATYPGDYRPTDPMPVMYHATVATKDLLDNSNATQERISRLIQGKIVIYGVSLPLVKDPVYSPVHGSIDGAYIHAMALDNLLTFKTSYIRVSPGDELFHRELTEFQPAILMMIAGAFIVLNRYRLIRAFSVTDAVHILREKDERFLLLAYYSLLLAVGSIGLIEFFVWSISPFNWLALFVVVHIAHWIEKRFFGVVVKEIESARSAVP